MATTIGPDAFIRDSIFQKVVDRTGVDPDKAKWTAFRLFVIGTVLSYVSIITIVPGFSPLEPGGLFNSLFMLGMMSVTVLHAWTQVRILKHAAYDLFGILARMIYVVTAAIMAYFSIRSMLGAYKGGAIAQIGMHGLTISWMAAVGATYLNLCRKPPPRRSTEGTRVRPLQNA